MKLIAGFKAAAAAFNSHPPTVAPNCSTGTGDFNVEVVGEQAYQDELRRLLQATGPERVVVVDVRPEPANKFDRNAVVVLSPQGRTMGYLPKDAMWIVQPVLAAFVRANGGRAVCLGHLVGGTVDKPMIGIWLDLDLARIGVRADQLPGRGLRKE